MPKYDVITFGSATQDVFLKSKYFKSVKVPGVKGGMGECFAHGAKIEVDRIIFDVGGGGANSATTFSRLGYGAAIVSRVGCDSAGHIVRDTLCNNGIGIEWLKRDHNHCTCYSTILLTSGGERTIFVYRGASRVFQTKDVPWDALSAKWFYIASLAGNLPFLRKVVQRAKQCGACVAWNPGSREIGLGIEKLLPLIKRVDYFQLNREEASSLIRQRSERIDLILKKMHDFNLPAVSVTDGSKGAYILTRNNSLFVSVSIHHAVNATGAGDAFGSAFVASLMRREDDIEYAARVATMNGSSVVSKMGAQHGLLKKWPSDAALRKIKIRVM